MFGGGSNDFVARGPGNDIMRGSASDEFFEEFPNVFGDEGNSATTVCRVKRGNDELSGGDRNDMIDAADDESPGSRHVVKYGPDNDTAIVNRNDILRDNNCETIKVRPNDEGQQARTAASRRG